MITAVCVVTGVVLVLAGCAIVAWQIGGGKGQHKGDAKPLFAVREPGTEPAKPAAAGRRRKVTASEPPWPDATPPEVTAAVDVAPEITRVIGWRTNEDVVNSLFTKATGRKVAEMTKPD